MMKLFVRHLGLEKDERVAGFIYIGTAKEPPQERDRPDLDDIIKPLAAVHKSS